MSQLAHTQNTDNKSENKSQSQSLSLNASQKLNSRTLKNEIRSAKQEIEIMEQLKTTSLTCFEMSQFNMAYKEQLAIFRQYSGDITLLQQRK